MYPFLDSDMEALHATLLVNHLTDLNLLTEISTTHHPGVPARKDSNLATAKRHPTGSKMPLLMLESGNVV